MTHLKAKSISEYAAKLRDQKQKVKPMMIEADVPRAQFWIASIEGFPKEFIYIECERFYDARDLARLVFWHVDSSRILLVLDERVSRCFPRIQLRWEGSAAGLNDLHKQARTVRGKIPRKPVPWTRLIDFKYEP